MSSYAPASAEGLVKSVQQIGLELAFVDPVAENSVEPLLSLVSALEAAIGGHGPAPIRAAVAAARDWLDERAAADGQLTEETISSLKAWHLWVITALDAWEQGAALPATPALWLTTAEPAATPAAEPSAEPTAEVPQETQRPSAGAAMPDQTVEISVGDLRASSA